MKSPRAVADFDSSTGMLRAIARYLHGQDFPGLGLAPTTRPLTRLVNLLDTRAREFVYTWSGWGDLKKLPARYALPGPLALSQLEAFLEQTAGRYQVQVREERPAPALAPGSAEQAQQPTFSG